MTTWDMIAVFAKFINVPAEKIGYAGLKDKHAMTKQYISIHKQHEEALEKFEHEGIKILSRVYHNNKIKIGHLKGNRFYIKLKKVNPTSAIKLDEALKKISNSGMPNYFGYQRFGNDGNNHIDGEKIAKGEKKERNPKIRKLLINSYQSHLFNMWLSRRLEINTLLASFKPSELEALLNMPQETIKKLQEQKHSFKVLEGDIMEHYPHGRLFDFDGSEDDLQRFNDRIISVTGMLCGEKVKMSSNIAGTIEKDFDDTIKADGARRYAWVYPTGVEGRFNQIEAQYELNFTLPKGSYATVLIEELAKKKIN